MILRKTVFILFSALILFSFYNLGKSHPEFRGTYFSYPAASLTSLFLSSPCIKSEDNSYDIPVSGHLLKVVPECSGFNFWMILTSLLLYRFIRNKGIREWKGYIPLIILSYCITIAVNSFRITSAFYISYYIYPHVGKNYEGAIHELMGIAVFLPALIVVYTLFERRFDNGKEKSLHNYSH